MNALEPILKPDLSRFTTLPVKYPDLYALYLKSIDCFWTFSELDFAQDVNDWKSMTCREQHFIKMVLAFFAGADGIINENLIGRFCDEVQIPEARLFYSSQIFFEGIHSVSYANMIDTFITNKKEKNQLFNSIVEIPAIKKKADWIISNVVSDAPFTNRLVAFACVEGILFSGSFASIFWLKKRNLFKGLAFANELISRDEALHVEFAVALFLKLENRPNQQIITDIIKGAVEIELEFICEAIPCRLIGMNSVLMSQYIKFVADRLSLQLGYDKIYNISNPFDWMQLISLERKSNFFEASVSEYALATKDKNDDIFDMECAF